MSYSMVTYKAAFSRSRWGTRKNPWLSVSAATVSYVRDQRLLSHLLLSSRLHKVVCLLGWSDWVGMENEQRGQRWDVGGEGGWGLGYWVEEWLKGGWWVECEIFWSRRSSPQPMGVQTAGVSSSFSRSGFTSLSWLIKEVISQITGFNGLITAASANQCQEC